MNLWNTRILVVAPHADDETLGCGGMLSRYGENASVLTLTLGRTPAGDHEQTLQERNRALAVLGVTTSDTNRTTTASIVFPGKQGRLDTVPMSDVVSAIDNSISALHPTSVFFPYASHHQDHEVTYRAVLAALRPREVTNRIRLVALYEYPYAAAWPPPVLPGGKFYLELSEHELGQKVRAFAEYKTQHGYLTPERVREWAVTRGHEVGFGAAEAFWLVRGIL